MPGKHNHRMDRLLLQNLFGSIFQMGSGPQTIFLIKIYFRCSFSGLVRLSKGYMSPAGLEIKIKKINMCKGGFPLAGI